MALALVLRPDGGASFDIVGYLGHAIENLPCAPAGTIGLLLPDPVQ